MNMYCVKVHWRKKDHSHFVMADDEKGAWKQTYFEFLALKDDFKILSVTQVEDFFTIKI